VVNLRPQCDETSPNCKKCLSFGVSCNYDPKVPDLQAFNGTVAEVAVPLQYTCSVNQTILGAINTSLSLCSDGTPGSHVYQLSPQDLERLS